MVLASGSFFVLGLRLFCYCWPPAVFLTLAPGWFFDIGLRLFCCRWPPAVFLVFASGSFSFLASGCFAVVGRFCIFGFGHGLFFPLASSCLFVIEPSAVFLVLASGSSSFWPQVIFLLLLPRCILVWPLAVFFFLASDCFLIIGPWPYFQFSPFGVSASFGLHGLLYLCLFFALGRICNFRYLHVLLFIGTLLGTCFCLQLYSLFLLSLHSRKTLSLTRVRVDLLSDRLHLNLVEASCHPPTRFFCCL